MLSRIAPGEIGKSVVQFTIDEEVTQGASIRQLFAGGRAPFTILYGTGMFITYFVLIGTLVWTPTLLRQTGMSVGEASLVLSLSNAGAIVGSLLSGLIIDRLKSGAYAVIATVFFVAFVATSAIGHIAPSYWAAMFSALSGCCLAAGSVGLYAFATLAYPTAMRSTGIGWGSGLSRVGATTGPILIGTLVAAQLSVSVSFLTIGAVVALNIGLVSFLGVVASHPRFHNGAIRTV
jgi:MFS family permease